MSPCCALPGGCGDPSCYLCETIAKLPQPGGVRHDLQKHDQADLRERRERKDLIFRPRKREAWARSTV